MWPNVKNPNGLQKSNIYDFTEYQLGFMAAVPFPMHLMCVTPKDDWLLNCRAVRTTCLLSALRDKTVIRRDGEREQTKPSPISLLALIKLCAKGRSRALWESE